MQNIFGPLVKIESDYDKQLKESQVQDEIVVRWEKGLSQKRTAYFQLPKLAQGDIRLAIGDELLLKYKGELHSYWEGKGFVIKLPNNFSEEVGIELSRDHKKAPADCTHSFEVDFVWKSTSYDRYTYFRSVWTLLTFLCSMQSAMREFAINENSVSSFLYHSLLGHTADAELLRVNMPKRFAVPGLPGKYAINLINQSIRSKSLSGPCGKERSPTPSQSDPRPTWHGQDRNICVNRIPPLPNIPSQKDGPNPRVRPVQCRRRPPHRKDPPNRIKGREDQCQKS